MPDISAARIMQVRHAPIGIAIIVGLSPSAAPGDLVSFPHYLTSVIVAKVNARPDVGDAGQPIGIIPTATDRRRYPVVPAMRLLSPARVVDDGPGLVLPRPPSLELPKLVGAVFATTVGEKCGLRATNCIIAENGLLIFHAAAILRSMGSHGEELLHRSPDIA